MEGALWATAAGVAFGLFQATNRRGSMRVDAYLATFVLLLVSVVGLGTVTLATQDLRTAVGAAPSAFGWFALAGAVHFLLGWTFLALSQRRIGASRTGVVAGTTPLFGTAVAFAVLGESVRPIALVGVVLVVAGILVLSLRRDRGGTASASATRNGLVFGVLTALCWAWSPVFIRWGLRELPSPLVGVTVGMAATTAAYGLALAIRGAPASGRLSRGPLGWLVLAGALVGFGIAAQWIALDLAPVAVVLALNQLAVPVVVAASPFIVGRQAEPFSAGTALGAAVVLAGTILIISSRGSA